MRRPKEYAITSYKVSRRLVQCVGILEELNPEDRTRNVLQGIYKDGYLAQPCEGDEGFSPQMWLTKQRAPNPTRDVIGKVPGLLFCFSDDALPPCFGVEGIGIDGRRVRRVTTRELSSDQPAVFCPEQKLLVLRDVERFSTFELALIVIQLAYLLNHSAEWPAVERWNACIALLEHFGGQAWQNVVAQERKWVRSARILRERTFEDEMFLQSGAYPARLLDQVFEGVKGGGNKRVSAFRQLHLAMVANLAVAEERGEDVSTALQRHDQLLRLPPPPSRIVVEPSIA